MKALALALGVITLAFDSAALAQAQTDGSGTQPVATLGGAGESCRARADCKPSLKCMNQVCTDPHEGETCGATSDCGGELKCIANKCTSTVAPSSKPASPSAAATTDDWLAFKLVDGEPHPFVGITLAGGFMTVGLSGNAIFTGGFNTFNGGFLFALNGGVFVGNHQLSFEIAPVTYVYDAKAPGPVFEMTGSYAYFIPLTDSGNIHVFWPIRFGVGMLAGPDVNAFGLAFFQLRADLIGAAIQVGHAVIDLHLPTFRYAITDKGGAQAHLLDWLFGVSVGYAF